MEFQTDLRHPAGDGLPDRAGPGLTGAVRHGIIGLCRVPDYAEDGGERWCLACSDGMGVLRDSA